MLSFKLEKNSMNSIEITISFFLLIILCYIFRNKNGIPTNWPIVGMLPALLINVHNINNAFIQVMEKTRLTFMFKGPWFTKMSMVASVDPANVHHVMSRNFNNYPKGSKFNEIFDILGDGHINSDSDLWKFHRKIAQSFVNQPQFNKFLLKKTYGKVENGLIHVLDHVSKKGMVVDLQDIFERFTFDVTCDLIVGYDPKTLVIDLPYNPSSRALDDAWEVFVHRHVLPSFIWKIQRWLLVGQEKKYRKAWETLDDFLYKCVSRKKNEMIEKSWNENKGHHVGVDLISMYMDDIKSAPTKQNNDTFLRDIILNFLIAGRDTTSTVLTWFFYSLSTNPRVIIKIKEELASVTSHVDEKDQYKYLSKNFENLVGKLVYLHGALCETLRLYPPVVFETKSPLKKDMLPSGHVVDQNTQIIFNMYAMGRMKSIWGEDCNDFKPERWISESGKIKFEPSYKFLAFNAGPRICVGKSMAFIQMKVIASTLIQHYHIQAVEEHPPTTNVSIIFRMKHGFNVKVFVK